MGLEPQDCHQPCHRKTIPIFGPFPGFSNEETLRVFHGATDRVVYSPKDSEAAPLERHQNLIKGARCCVSKKTGGQGDLGLAGHPLQTNW